MKHNIFSNAVMLGVLAVFLSGCAATSSTQRSLVETETTATPSGRAVPPVSAGSLTPASTAINGEYRSLLTGYRASRVGDTLTVVLDELTRATKDGSTTTNREARNRFGAGADLTIYDTTRRTGAGQLVDDRDRRARGSVDIDGSSSFNGSGVSSASNRFVGTISVTVVEVLANGNLRVAGEKRLAVGAEEEIIRFGGVVAPINISRNTVLSSHVADARIEYRGAGATDLAKRPGWLTRFMLRASPN